MNRLRIGKCVHCKRAIEWSGSLPRLADAFCPICGRKLAQTTHSTQLQRSELGPIGFTAAHVLRCKSPNARPA